jgi:hypothetical protein
MNIDCQIESFDLMQTSMTCANTRYRDNEYQSHHHTAKTYKMKQLRQKLNIERFELHLQPKPKKNQVVS